MGERGEGMRGRGRGCVVGQARANASMARRHVEGRGKCKAKVGLALMAEGCFSEGRRVPAVWRCSTEGGVSESAACFRANLYMFLPYAVLCRPMSLLLLRGDILWSVLLEVIRGLLQ